MSEKHLVSIYCPTYNSGVKRTLLSLESARLQEYSEKELIIGDDGSSDETVQAIESFLSKYEQEFKRVVFIKHDTNIGTVKNLESIYGQCRGELMVGTSPGDPLYSNRTLSDIAEYYESKNVDFFVALARGYRVNGSLHEVSFLRPNPKQRALMMNPQKSFLKLVQRNFISGISFVRTADLNQMEELRLPKDIKLLEDWPFVLLYTLNGKPIHLMNKFIRWYEYGTGISTRHNPSSQQLSKDLNSILNYINYILCNDDRFSNTSQELTRIINRRIDYERLSKVISNRYLRLIIKTINFPDFVVKHLIDYMVTKSSFIYYKKVLRDLESEQGQGFKPLLIEYHS